MGDILSSTQSKSWMRAFKVRGHGGKDRITWMGGRWSVPDTNPNPDSRQATSCLSSHFKRETFRSAYLVEALDKFFFSNLLTKATFQGFSDPDDQIYKSFPLVSPVTKMSYGTSPSHSCLPRVIGRHPYRLTYACISSDEHKQRDHVDESSTLQP